MMGDLKFYFHGINAVIIHENQDGLSASPKNDPLAGDSSLGCQKKTEPE